MRAQDLYDMLEDYFFTKNTKWVLWGAFILIVALLIFHAGMVVGQHRPHARANEGPAPGGMLGGFMPTEGYVESGHGAVGTIATVTLPTFILQSRDGLTQTIYAGSTTVVTGGLVPNTSALVRNEAVIVIGDPNDTDDGYLDARIIHILSAPPPR
jgi:hypothetical protein